ncbi:MAG: hypothetical protein Kow0037_05530 [Calditrichia bacterium]
MTLAKILSPLKSLRRNFGGDSLQGFYRVKIINRSKAVIWLAKNTLGDLHDIIPPGRSLEIRFPVAQKMEFYAYKASSNLAVSGLNYYDKREFTHDDQWVIQ